MCCTIAPYAGSRAKPFDGFRNRFVTVTESCNKRAKFEEIGQVASVSRPVRTVRCTGKMTVKVFAPVVFAYGQCLQASRK
eukprot:1693210-Amphidinium_carterae.1